MRRWRLRSWSAAAAILVAGTLMMLAWSMASAWTHPPLTPDSWSYLMLARSFHSTAYHIPVIRQYQYHSDFGDSFPPAWPMVLLAAGLVLHDDPWLGIIVAAAISIALLPLLALLLRPFIRARRRRYFAAAACWACLLAFGPFLDEVLSGRSIPLAMAGYLALAIAMVQPARPSVGAGLLAGFAGGLLWMTRFDAAPVVLILGVFVPLVWNRGGRLRWWSGYWLALAVILAPWAIYSRHAFGVSWATAPAMMAKSVSPSLVVDWYPVRPRTIADAPLEWASRVAGNVPALLASLWRVAARYAYASSLLLIFAAWTVVQAGNLPPRPGRSVRVGLLILFALVGQLAGPVIIGVFDLRYYSPLLATVTIFSVTLLINSRIQRYRAMLLAPLAIGLVLGWRKGLGTERGQRMTATQVAAPTDVGRWPDVSGISLLRIGACLPADARLLVLEQNDAPYYVGYYLRRTTLEVPDNWSRLTDSDRLRFLTEFRVTHVLMAPDVPAAFGSRAHSMDGCPGLQRVLPPPRRTEAG
jgi:hypothetical protein